MIKGGDGMETVKELITEIYSIPAVNYTIDAVVKMVLAVVFSGVIGFEREHSHRPAGFRTHILVAVGSTLVMMTSKFVFPSLILSYPYNS